MEKTFPLIILISLYGLIILTLLGLWLSSVRKRYPLAYHAATRAKNRLEQKLILEAIAAFANIEEPGAIGESIGKHAVEMTGFDLWIVWQRKGAVYRSVSTSEHFENQNVGEFDGSSEPELIEWMKRNSGPVVVSKDVLHNLRSDKLREIFGGFRKGLLIPFLDSSELLGFITLGGKTFHRERRSYQFLSLFGANSALWIKKVMREQADREMQRHQQRTEKMAALGKLAGGMAHEIRNPLTFLRVSAEHLEESENLSEQERNLLGGMIGEVNRINKLIEELLSLGRVGSDLLELVDLEHLLQKIARLAGSRISEEKIELEVSLALGGSVVYGSEDKLQQLFMNLLLNAVEAVQGGETRLVRVIAETEGTQAVVTVRDSGAGIPNEIRERIFEPFFTTKESGTGLGLALCYNIVSAHGGSIELAETGEGGACFVVRLPIYLDADVDESRGESR
jgi:signal transduction histidine kinase